MEELCGARCAKGACWMWRGHSGQHQTRGGVSFTWEEVHQWQKSADLAEAEPNAYMNRAQRRAAKSHYRRLMRGAR